LEFENKSVNDMWKYLISVIDTCVTVFRCINIKPVKKSPWLSKDSKVALRKRKKAWLEYVKNKSTERLSDYKTIRNYVVQRQSRVPEAASKTDEKSARLFYKYVRSKRHNAVAVKSLKKADGNSSQNDKKSAEVLCHKFQQVFVVAEWLACQIQARKSMGSNHSRHAVE